MTPSDILFFWFGELDAQGLADSAHAEKWWRKDDAFDLEVRSRFLLSWQAIMAGKHEDWLSTPSGRLAYVVVLDQFSRNMFRGDVRAFSADARALAVAWDGVEQGHDQQLPGQQRTFLYMPFMHSEQLEDQQRCVELFMRYRDQTQGALRVALDNNVRFAEQHRDIIARFGRFPHRNATLGRTSSAEELAFLQQPGSSF